MKIKVVRPCSHCKGSGYVPCPRCLGKDKNCPTCHGTNEVTCIICDGLRSLPIHQETLPK